MYFHSKQCFLWVSLGFLRREVNEKARDAQGRPGSSMSQAHRVRSDVTEGHTEPNLVWKLSLPLLDQEDPNTAVWEEQAVAITSWGRWIAQKWTIPRRPFLVACRVAKICKVQGGCLCFWTLISVARKPFSPMFISIILSNAHLV